MDDGLHRLLQRARLLRRRPGLDGWNAAGPRLLRGEGGGALRGRGRGGRELLASGGGGAGVLAGEGVVTMKPTWLMDAGELREWVVERFGQQLVVGGPRIDEGLRWVRRLAQRAGLPYDEVPADVVADAEARWV